VIEEDQMFNHTLVKRSLATGLALGAVVVPATAQARLELDPNYAPGPAPARVVHQRPLVSAQPGFHWADAGIGAGGVIVLLGAATGAAGAMRRRRPVGTA
jgi:hypothetical protein